MKYFFLLLFSISLVGCRQQQNPDSSQLPVPKKTANSSTNRESESSNRQQQKELIEKTYGDLNLRPSSFDATTIRAALPDRRVKAILKIDQEITAKQDEWIAEWTYRWKDAMGKSRSIRVSVMLEDMEETQMTIQAGVRTKMVEKGQAEKVDLAKYGAVGIWRTKKGTEDLQICTANQLFVIAPRNAGGDIADKKRIATDLAQALFQVGSNQQSKE